MTRPVLFAVLALVALTACGSHKRPAVLLDGRPPGTVPRSLSLDDGVVTRVRVLQAEDLRAGRRTGCPELRPASRVVERTSVEGSSLTFLDSTGAIVLSCDRSRDVYSEGGGWCGHSAGKLVAGELEDARLSVCQGLHGDRQVAFAWIDPLPSARWVMVDQGFYTELYPTAGGMPVRVATTSEVENAEAVFHVAQYTADGRRLSRNTLETYVAG